MKYKTPKDVLRVLNRAKDMIEMQHAYAKGETCVTDEQLTSVMLEVGGEIGEVLSKIEGGVKPKNGVTVH